MLNEEPKSFLKKNDKIITEKSVKQSKNKYLAKLKFPNYEIVERHFEIIEAFANREYFFYNSAKENVVAIKEDDVVVNIRNKNNQIVNIGISEAVKEQNILKAEENSKVIKDSKNNYFVTDIHGDLFSLLQVLTGNEDNTKNPAQFKKGEPCVIYRDVTKNPPETYNDVSDFQGDLKNLVPIPNLEPNPDFQGNFIFGGDIIDRGNETESCFYALENLMNENQLLGDNKKNIVYEIGNHEEFVMLGDFKNSLLNGFQCLASDPKERIKYMQKAMQNMLQNNTMQLMHTDNSNIYCHAVINRNSIKKALEGIEKKFSDEALKEYFNEQNITLEQIKALKDQINNDKKLNQTDIELLVNSLNTLTKYYFNGGFKNEEIKKLFLNPNSTEGLLWDRENELYYQSEVKGIGVFFVGHDAQKSHLIKFKNQHCFLDLATSHGYNEIDITFSHVVEIDANSKIFSNIKQFDRELLKNIYQDLKNSLNIITKGNKKQITENQIKDSSSSSEISTPKPIVKDLNPKHVLNSMAQERSIDSDNFKQTLNEEKIKEFKNLKIVSEKINPKQKSLVE